MVKISRKDASSKIARMLAEQNRRAKRATNTIFCKGRSRKLVVKYAREHVRDILSFFVEDLPLSELSEPMRGTVSFSVCSTSSDLTEAAFDDTGVLKWNQRENCFSTAERDSAEAGVSDWDDILKVLEKARMHVYETTDVDGAVGEDVSQGASSGHSNIAVQSVVCSLEHYREGFSCWRTCACPFRHAKESRFFP